MIRLALLHPTDVNDLVWMQVSHGSVDKIWKGFALLFGSIALFEDLSKKKPYITIHSGIHKEPSCKTCQNAKLK